MSDEQRSLLIKALEAYVSRVSNPNAPIFMGDAFYSPMQVCAAIKASNQLGKLVERMIDSGVSRGISFEALIQRFEGRQ